MLKSLLLTAAAWSVVGLAACAAPQPRYAIVPDPLAAAALSPATPPPAAEPEALPLLEAAAVETEVETPRAAPLGRVETTVLAQLPPPAVTPPEASPALSEAPAPTSAEATLSHVVGPGDTFFAVGRRYGVGPQAIAELNGLTFASTLRLGQRLQLPAGARDRGAQAAAPGSGPSLAQAGSASPPTAASPVRATVVETEPPAVETPPVVASPSTVAPPVTAPPVTAPPRAAATPPTSPSAAPTPATAPATAPPPSAVAPVIAAPPPVVAPTPAPGLSTGPANAALAGRGLFTWPLRGDLISGFGPKGVNQRSDGVNISAAEGDPVRAAAAGTVVYAGDQVKGGFGKLVLIEHENRWFTAYAHLADITVRMRDRIAQNQQIGRAGRTGNVGAPQLYFEVRHAPAAGERARPVDPLPLLPQ